MTIWNDQTAEHLSRLCKPLRHGIGIVVYLADARRNAEFSLRRLHQ